MNGPFKELDEMISKNHKIHENSNGNDDRFYNLEVEEYDRTDEEDS